MRQYLFAWILALVIALTARGTVRYVNPAGEAGNDGLSWATALPTVSAALTLSTAGDQVWVAKGTYIDYFILPSGVSLYGGFAGTETALCERLPFPRSDPDPNEAIVDALWATHAVTIPDGAVNTTRIDGLTIRNGSSFIGGGIYCRAAAPVIANNKIIDNLAAHAGGGIYCDNYSSPWILNNNIEGNYAYWGAGIYCDKTSAAIEYNCITENYGTDGAGIYCDHYSFPDIAHNTITYNLAGDRGGGIYCIGDAVSIRNNFIKGNRARSGAGICSFGVALVLNNALVGNGASGYGGGVYCFSESIQLANNMIVGNQAAVYGGGIYSPGSSMIVNNTIAANSSGWGGGVAFFFSPTIINNIIAFNSSGLYTSGGSPDLRNNCVFNPCGADYTNLYPGIGDISLHPQHMREPDAGPDQKWGTADDDYGDLRLRPGSPCIDVGGVSMIGTYLTHDIRGRDRFVDDPSSADCRWVPGTCGFAPIVDIGAFEFQAVPGDFDGNEEVDADDLAAFEACGSGPAIASTADCHWADLDHDNDVDADDFAAFQRSYAPSAGM